MKKVGLIIGLAILLGLLSYYLVFRNEGPAVQLQTPPTEQASPQQQDPPADNAASGTNPATVSDLPNMVITKLDDTRLLVKDLKGKVILVLFQPDCDHCQRETKEIQENLAAFKDYTLYFISNYPSEVLRKFAQDYKLAFEPNVVFATTSLDDILNTLGPQPSPSLYIYDEHGRLVKSFLGETKVENIKPHL